MSEIRNGLRIAKLEDQIADLAGRLTVLEEIIERMEARIAKLESWRDDEGWEEFTADDRLVAAHEEIRKLRQKLQAAGEWYGEALAENAQLKADMRRICDENEQMREALHMAERQRNQLATEINQRRANVDWTAPAWRPVVRNCRISAIGELDDELPV